MLGSELRKRREKTGLTQGELAQRLGVHRTTVNRWEQGTLTIERPAMLRVMLQVIDDELLADPAWREEYNRRATADMERRLSGDHGSLSEAAPST